MQGTDQDFKAGCVVGAVLLLTFLLGLIVGVALVSEGVVSLQGRPKMEKAE